MIRKVRRRLPRHILPKNENQFLLPRHHMIRYILCKDCGERGMLQGKNSEVYNFRLRIIAKLHTHNDCGELRCDHCYSLILYNNIAFALTYWRKGELQPTLWELDFCGEGIGPEFMQAQLEGNIKFKPEEILIREPSMVES